MEIDYVTSYHDAVTVGKVTLQQETQY